MKVCDGMSTRFMNNVPNHCHKPAPEIYMKCSQCGELKSCFCTSCVYTVGYRIDEEIEKSKSDNEALTILVKEISQRTTEENESLKLILTTSESAILLCSYHCFNSWRTIPTTI